jgi:hypothetical protein
LKKNLNLIRVENSVQRRGKGSHEETSESTIYDILNETGNKKIAKYIDEIIEQIIELAQRDLN